MAKKWPKNGKKSSLSGDLVGPTFVQTLRPPGPPKAIPRNLTAASRSRQILSADMALSEVHGDCQVAHCSELTRLHPPPPGPSSADGAQDMWIFGVILAGQSTPRILMGFYILIIVFNVAPYLAMRIVFS